MVVARVSLGAQVKMAGMGAYDKFMYNYHRRYIRTGSAAPVLHVMGIVFGLGVLVHAKAHSDRLKDPRYVPDH